MGTFIVIANPRSGASTGAQQPVAHRVRQVFTQAGRACEVVSVPSAGALAAASRAAAARAGPGDVLVAAGGDGTVATVAQAAWERGCPLGVVPCGTFNYFARVQGIPQDPQAAARALLRAHERPVDIGLVNGRVFLVNASLGLYPQLLQDREAFKSRFGRRRWVAALAAVATLVRWRHQLTLEIEADGQSRHLRTPTLVVVNNRLQVERLGLPADPRRPVGEGWLAGVAARPIGSWALFTLMLRGAFGTLGDAQDVEHFACRSLSVGMRGLRRARVAADGEIDRLVPPLRFEVAPRPLRLMAPCEQDRVPVG
ncbi:diacylglycerol/lipid kinase family protein [Ramlibacter sp. MAHUQ-53]|uniref:diacylglycerol/lipid kinase family protein n=1 Tax=unclassified Ramlibacter TaxID=2617605 RepID=UPI003631A615